MNSSRSPSPLRPDPRNPIRIVGGGLAGLTLGIGLRQRDVPVTVIEAGFYPRHRVCGEFISGNGQHVLRRMGLNELFLEAGAIEVRTARFVAGQNQSPVRSLPPALGISRFDLDALLAREFKRLGGILRTGERWVADGKSEAGVIHASGRRPHRSDRGWRWFGLKVHARNIDLPADLEMHISRNSYVGVNRINHGEVNVCGLFRSRPGNLTERSKLDLLRGEPGSTLNERLRDAEFIPGSFCSVAGLCLTPERAANSESLRIGDALTMIPPATGNGMSMAFESAELAVEPLAQYSSGQLSWEEARRRIATLCDGAFAQRLRWARFLQFLMLSPIAHHIPGRILMHSGRFWDCMFSRTR